MHRFFPLLLVFSLALTLPPSCQASPTLWGTYRPHALIGARAATPHSPIFGFVYHPPTTLDLRHLATDSHDSIASFSYSRHDGRSFGDQQVRDVALNLLIRSHFHHHPSAPHAWALRVAAQPLDPSKPVAPLSLVFYAANGPDEIHPRHPRFESDNAPLWGSVGLAQDITVGEAGVHGHVALQGVAQSVGGEYRVVVHEPSYGSLPASSLATQSAVEEAAEVDVAPLGGSGSRARRRTHAEKPGGAMLPLDAFHVAGSLAAPREAWAVEENLRRVFRQRRKVPGDGGVQLLEEGKVAGGVGGGVFVQRVVEATFEMDVTFVRTEGRGVEEVRRLERELSGERLDLLLEGSRVKFDEQFERVFGLGKKGVSKEEVAFAKAALSNVLGGIGFFYGSSVVREKRESGAENGAGGAGVRFLEPVELLTATPSRAMFPRGFLWDEGFHQLIVQRWDAELSRACMASWMRVIQKDGWIPREQILGLEARSRFPQHVQHLMIQNPSVANPPTILMPLRVFASLALDQHVEHRSNESVCDGASSAPETCMADHSTNPSEFLSKMLAPFTEYYAWLKRTQSGAVPNSFRWRGRSLDIKAPDGYPLTLASGLDDYPRGRNPSDKERHVDLHSWMAWAAGALSKLYEKAGRDVSQFRAEHIKLRALLTELHGGPSGNALSMESSLLCDYDGEVKMCHIGYVTVLPLALGLLDPRDDRVASILDSLEDESLLRSKAGVRSLSRSDDWYRKGDDYWTGSVWMPFNFLTLAALRTKYSVENGPYKTRAQALFLSLQKSILENSFRVFSETGQLWENYSPEETGNGKSGRQFTGWSALVCLMYADMYDGVT